MAVNVLTYDAGKPKHKIS